MKFIILIFSLLTFFENFAQKRVGINTINPQKTLDVNGSINADSNIFVGHKLYIKEGNNSTIGEVTLVGGIAQVFTNKITLKSKVFLSYKKPTFATLEPSILYVPQETIVNGISFIIKSELSYPEPSNIVNEANTSIVYWWIVDSF